VDPQNAIVQNRVFRSPEPDDEEDVSSDDVLADEGDAKDQLKAWLNLLPPLEADLVELRAMGKTEQDIGTIFGITQSGVSYHLAQAQKRLRWLAETEPYRVTGEDLRALLPEEVCREALRRGRHPGRGSVRTRGPSPSYRLSPFLAAVVDHTCLSEARRRVGGSSGWATESLRAVVRGLEEMAMERPELLNPARYLSAIRARPRILWSWRQRRRWPQKTTAQPRGMKAGPSGGAW
jgi:hypothetical protein